MAKNKKNKGKSKGKKFSKEKDGFVGAGTLGTNVRQLGTTITGVLISEVVKPSVKEAVEVTKETVNDFTPSLADVVTALKDRPTRSLQQSVDTATSNAGLTLGTAIDTAKNVVQALNSGNSSKKGKKGEKKGINRLDAPGIFFQENKNNINVSLYE